MEWRTPPGDKLMIDTPDELYAKYISIVAGLPDDATVWPLPLCNTYFSALVGPLQDKMEHDNFRMPGLNGLTTKTLQVGALRIIRSAATQSFKSLNDEEKRLRSLLSRNVMNRGSHNLKEQIQCNQTQQTQSYQPQPYNGTDGSIHSHSPSLVEDTLRRYGSPPLHPVDTTSMDTPSRVGPDGISYPFNPDDSLYTSKFSAEFRGCFKCGKSDHFNRRGCPLKDVDDKSCGSTD